MIEFQTSVAKVSVDFKDKINILLGDSGEGKSLLLKLLAVYFREHNIPFDTVDWNTSEEALWDRLNGNTLELPCTSIISMKRIQRVDCGLYDVIYYLRIIQHHQYQNVYLHLVLESHLNSPLGVLICVK